MTVPRLSDIRASRVCFSPGDRILVRYCGPLSSVLYARLTRAANRYAGCDVRVLIVDPTQVSVHTMSGSDVRVLVDAMDIIPENTGPFIRMNCSVIQIPEESIAVFAYRSVPFAGYLSLVQEWFHGVADIRLVRVP